MNNRAYLGVVPLIKLDRALSDPGSLRGAISGVIKKKLGLTIVSERVNDIRIYRIAK